MISTPVYVIIGEMATLAQPTSRRKQHPFQTDDPALGPIADKVMAQQRLSGEDALALYRSGDILAIGWLGNHVRERMHCLLYTSPSPRDRTRSRMPSSA